MGFKKTVTIVYNAKTRKREISLSIVETG